jgi:HEAT repeat protein
MVSRTVLDAGLALLSVLAIASCAAIALSKLLRGLADARARRAEGQVRPRLIRLVAGDEAEDLATHGAEARAVDRLASDLLRKVRGEAHESLVAVLTRRGRIERARRGLRDRGVGTRARAAELLGAARDGHSGPLLVGVLTRDRDRRVRIVAARALGRVGGAEAVSPLFTGLADGLPAGTVAHAILQIGSPAEAALRGELVDGSPAGRALAAQLLGLLGAVGSVDALAGALAVDPVPSVRVDAAVALGRIGAAPGVVALVDALAADRTPDERVAAAEALGRMSATDAAGALAPLVTEADVRLARAAARSLAGLGENGRSRLASLARGADVAAEHSREALARVS